MTLATFWFLFAAFILSNFFLLLWSVWPNVLLLPVPVFLFGYYALLVAKQQNVAQREKLQIIGFSSGAFILTAIGALTKLYYESEIFRFIFLVGTAACTGAVCRLLIQELRCSTDPDSSARWMLPGSLAFFIGAVMTTGSTSSTLAMNYIDNDSLL